MIVRLRRVATRERAMIWLMHSRVLVSMDGAVSGVTPKSTIAVEETICVTHCTPRAFTQAQGHTAVSARQDFKPTMQG